MSVDPRLDGPRNRRRTPTEASQALAVARRRAHLQLRELGAALGLHPRTIGRWESGATHPSKEHWAGAAAHLARIVPEEAVALAKAAGVPSPIVAPPPVDVRAIEEAIMRAADRLDVSPRRVRAAVRELVQATTGARGGLDDLARAAEEKGEWAQAGKGP